MTEEKHEIDRIAEELKNVTLVIYGPDVTPDDKYSAQLETTVGLEFVAAEAPTELEAKDALLAKLRAIVCPFYDKLLERDKAFTEMAAERNKVVEKYEELKSELSAAEKKGYDAGMTEEIDEKIRAILDPIKSRMYAIEINHAEWLRENNLHLVMTGPGDDSYKQIKSLVEAAEKRGEERGWDAAREFHPTDKGAGISGRRLRYNNFEDWRNSAEYKKEGGE